MPLPPLPPSPAPQQATLQTLTDVLVSVQNELSDVEVFVAGHESRIETLETNVGTLQDPPRLPPPPLLEWFSDGHNIREVDTLLDTDLSTVEGSVTDNAESITALQDGLDSETSDRMTADDDLTSTDVLLQDQITDNLTTLNQEITDRSTLSLTVSDGLDAANARIDDVQSDITNLSTSSSTQITSNSAQIAALSASLQTANTKIALLQGIGVDPAGAQASQITSLTTIANDAATAVALETTNRTNADLALQASINSTSASLSGISSSLTTEKSDRIAADNTINSSLTSLSSTVAGHTGLISAETASRIAADSALQAIVDGHTASITTNSNNIAQEITDRAAADTAITDQQTTNTANIATNTANIATNTTSITNINSRFSVVKDGSGYITDWQIIDQSAGAGDFNLRNLNNDVRLQNPGYVGKYFAPVAMFAASSGTNFDTLYGTGPSTLFHGTDGNDYTRSVKVYSTLSTGINGSVFKGVNSGTGGDLQRLGQVVTTFLINYSGYTNGQLSAWYRIKAGIGDTTQRWFAVSQTSVSIPSPRTYELASGRAVVQISVTADQVIEFGFTNVLTLDSSRSTSNTVIYDGFISVQALNMVTIA